MLLNENVEYKKKPHILIVDDILKNLQVLGSILIEANYEISMASNGFQALKLLEKTTPDLVLLDILMPDIDGYEVCQRVKTNPKYSELPIVFLTAKTETQDIVKGFQLGGIDYITKPFKKEELLFRIKTHLDLKFSRELIIKQNEELLRLNREKNEFLGIAAHDLKNPLVGIKGIIDTLTKNFNAFEKNEVMDFLELVQKSTTFMFQIITDLLDVNAIEEGMVKFNLTNFDAVQMLKFIISDFEKIAMAKDIKIHLVDDGSIANICSDPVKTKQIFDNIISNAIKFSPFHKNIWVNCLVNQDADSFRVEVKDEGPGLSEEDKKKLFSKFAKLTPRPTNQEHSTGLGLSIVKKLIEGLHGKIWCESELNSGSSFFIEFPLAKP